MDIKKLIGDAGTKLNRVVQQAEETFLTIEKTEYDPEYLDTVKKINTLKYWTERFMNETSKVLEPNMAYRLENKVKERMDKPSERATPLEVYGTLFETASQPLAQYSAELSQVLSTFGNIQIRVGVTRREFQKKSTDIYVNKLKYMLENDIKTFLDDHTTLENLRLDLDAAKAKTKKNLKEDAKRTADEAYQTALQSFENQLSKNKISFQNVDELFKQHKELIKAFAEAQKNHFNECLKELERLERLL